MRLGKTFDVTYVRVLFESPRPESWGIYKRKNERSPWEPYQFYSATCRDTYDLPESKETIRGDDTRVLCTSEFSDISPLTKGTVAFSTLEGRPSAYYFETNPELQVIGNNRKCKYRFQTERDDKFFQSDPLPLFIIIILIIATMEVLIYLSFLLVGMGASDRSKNHSVQVEHIW